MIAVYPRNLGKVLDLSRCSILFQMATRKTVKVAYDLDADTKYNLTILKAELRRKGIPATETGILEVLVDGADINMLARAYRKHLGD